MMTMFLNWETSQSRATGSGRRQLLTCAEAGLDAGEDEEEEGAEEEEEEEEVKVGRIADVRMSCRRRRESRQEVKT